MLHGSFPPEPFSWLWYTLAWAPRGPVVLETKDEKLFVAPDNGLLKGVMNTLGVAHAYEITNRSLMRPGKITATFHGRDIYGPVAAHLAAGINSSDVGPPIEELAKLPIARAKQEKKALAGAVVHVDRYGNLMTNISSELVEETGLGPGARISIIIGDRRISATFTATYNNVPEGEWLALVNAQEVVEIARNMENAAQTTGASTGTQVRIEIIGK